MTDRELLELAAKSCRIVIEWKNDIAYTGAGSYMPQRWNPLTDDGDALRLAVKLNITVQPYPIYAYPKHSVMARRYFDGTTEAHPDVVEVYGEDQFAATRRAIVRAAAEIGKQMP